MISRRFRRLIIDLTPMVDVIMILLFGVMINSVLVSEKQASDATAAAKANVAAEVEESRRQGESDRAKLALFQKRTHELEVENEQLREQLAKTVADLAKSDPERADVLAQLRRERFELARMVAQLLQLDSVDEKKLRERLDAIAGLDAQRLAQLAQELRAGQDPVKVYTAVRRIEEMTKVFTFVDLSLNANDFLRIAVDGVELIQFSARGKLPDELQAELRRILEAASFQEMVLVLFSYEGDARDFTVERSESAAHRLLESYRTNGSMAGRQFRFGRIGMIDPVLPTKTAPNGLPKTLPESAPKATEKEPVRPRAEPVPPAAPTSAGKGS